MQGNDFATFRSEAFSMHVHERLRLFTRLSEVGIFVSNIVLFHSVRLYSFDTGKKTRMIS